MGNLNRNEQIKSEVNIENINIRINNALATANKDSLRKIKEQWSLIDDYLYDDAYSVVAGLLKDSIPVVASEKYIIVSNSLESVANRINDNFSLIDEFLLKIFKNRTKKCRIFSKIFFLCHILIHDMTIFFFL